MNQLGWKKKLMQLQQTKDRKRPQQVSTKKQYQQYKQQLNSGVSYLDRQQTINQYRKEISKKNQEEVKSNRKEVLIEPNTDLIDSMQNFIMAKAPYPRCPVPKNEEGFKRMDLHDELYLLYIMPHKTVESIAPGG